MSTQIQLRRDTSNNWTYNDPILAQGEIGIDLTNNQLKIGIGNTTWSNLPYFAGGGTSNSSYSNSNVTSFLSSGGVGDIIPDGNNIHSLGNSTNQWLDLWVSGNTIYINQIPVSLDSNSSLTVAGNPVVTANAAANGATNVTELTVSGNIFVENVNSTANVSANYFIGNGAFLTGISGGGGNSNYSNANVASYLPTDPTIISLTGITSNNSVNIAVLQSSAYTNSNLANIGSNNILTTGTVTADSFIGDGSQLTGLPTSYGNSDLANIGSNNIGTTGSITGGYLIGDGSNITNLPAGNYSNSNVADYLANANTAGDIYSGNLIIQAGNTIVFAEGGLLDSVTAAGFEGTMTFNSKANRGISITAGGTVPGASYSQLQWVDDIDNYDPYGTANSITNWVYVQNDGIYLQNIDSVNSPGYDYLWKFDVNGNLTSPGNIVNAGDVYANAFVGDGGLLSNITSSYGDSNVSTYLESGITSPITTSNALTANSITSTSIIIAQDANIANTVTANLFIGDFQGNISGNLSVPGANTQVLFNNNDVAAADIGFTYDASTKIVTVGNAVTAVNVITSGQVFSSGNITSNNVVIASILSVGVNNIAITNNLIKSESSTITIDPIGDGSVAGNVVVQGNLQVTGNLTYVDVSTAVTSNLIWQAANSANAPSEASGGGLAVGPGNAAYATWTYNSGGNSWVSNLPIQANGGANVDGPLTGATTGLFSNTVTAGAFSGDGSALTNISGAAVTGQVSNAVTAGTVYTPAQPVITSVGNLTSLTISGTTNAVDINASGNVISVGNLQGNSVTSNSLIVTELLSGNLATFSNTVTAAYFTGDGSNLVNVPGSSLLANGTSNLSIPVANGNITMAVNGTTIVNLSDISVAIGSGINTAQQVAGAVAVGTGAGASNQQANAVAIGQGAGSASQGNSAVAIGLDSGGTNQAANSVAIGASAHASNSAIVLNATGAIQNGQNAGFYVNPVRNDVANVSNVVTYNSSNKELTYANNISLTGSATSFAAFLKNAAEQVNITAAAPSASQTVYVANGGVQYFSVAATANWTLNITFSASATMNSTMVVGQATTVAVLTTQGVTAFYNNVVQVDGVTVTPYWQGGSPPSSGNTTGLDVYTYTVIKTGNSAYAVLASQTQF